MIVLVQAIGATALFLATKVEENCRKVKELVIACCRIAQKNPALAVDDQSKEYWRWRDTILHNEDLLLEALCFDLSHEPPYKILFDSLNRLGEQNNKTLRDTGWTFLNDSNTTMLCLLHPSHTIAASALYCSARHHGIAIPDQRGRAWWDVLGVPLRDIRRACNYMASVYENSSLKHSEKMYTWTPEDGDPLIAKTRARGPSNSESPTPSIRSDKDRPLHDRIGSTGGVASQAPEQGRGNSKRQRDENTETGTEQRALVSIDGDSRGLLSEHTKSENISQGEVVKEDRDPKRQKVEDRSRDVSHKHQAESSEKPQQNGVAEPSIERQQEVENDAKPDILKSTSSLPRLPPENGVSEVAREEDLSEEGEVGS